MDRFADKAKRYRDRADELLAKADDFHDPENRATVMAEECMAMADRLEQFEKAATPSIPVKFQIKAVPNRAGGISWLHRRPPDQ